MQKMALYPVIMMAVYTILHGTLHCTDIPLIVHPQFSPDNLWNNYSPDMERVFAE